MRWIFPILPMPKQSFRFSNVRGHILKFQPKKVSNFKKTIQIMATELEKENQFFTNKDVVVKHLIFSFPWKTNATKKQKQQGWIYKDTKPDLDNLEKSLWDALEGILFENDSRIVEKQLVRKIYSDNAYIDLSLMTLEEVRQFELFKSSCGAFGKNEIIKNFDNELDFIRF